MTIMVVINPTLVIRFCNRTAW